MRCHRRHARKLADPRGRPQHPVSVGAGSEEPITWLLPARNRRPAGISTGTQLQRRGQKPAALIFGQLGPATLTLDAIKANGKDWMARDAASAADAGALGHVDPVSGI